MKAQRPKSDRSSSRATVPAGAPAAGASTPEGTALDLRLVRELAKVISQYQLTEITLEHGGGRVRVRRGGDGLLSSLAPAGTAAGLGGATPAPTPTMAPVTPAADPGLVEITSPFVGTFFRAPAPEAPPYVETGHRIRAGQVLCIVEAMKLMNEIESEVSGTIVEILGQDGQPVEYGEVLFRVRVE